MNKAWFVYVLRCSDNSLYCGITTDVKRRLYEHNSTKRGAKYTRSRRPVQLEYSSFSMNRSEAASAEARFKKLSSPNKRKLLENHDKINSFLCDSKRSI